MYKAQILEAKKRTVLGEDRCTSRPFSGLRHVRLPRTKQSQHWGEAAKLCALLDLGPDVGQALQTPPMKATDSPDAPKDPLIYRFHEITLVYGETTPGSAENADSAGN
jgi:cyanate lyase